MAILCYYIAMMDYFLLGIILSGGLTLRFVQCLGLGSLEAESEMCFVVKVTYRGELLSIDSCKAVTGSGENRGGS